MLRITSIASLLLLLLISSCKKQIIKDKPKVNDQVEFIESNIQEGVDIFSPVSKVLAKQFADNQEKNINTNSKDINKNISTLNSDVKELCDKDFFEFARQNEAKLSDIPVPFSSEPIKEYFNSSLLKDQKRVVLGYVNSMDIDSIVTFYNQEMERLGWQTVAFFDGLETLMVFKKPSRVCSISIREPLKPNLQNLNIKKSKKRSSGDRFQVQELCKIIINAHL